MFGRNFKKELKKLNDPLADEALVVISKLEDQMTIMQQKYDVHSWIEETKRLNTTIKTQQEALNASCQIIDDLRGEIKTLKDGQLLQKHYNELAKYKKLLEQTNLNYQNLRERYDLLMSKYIKQ